MIYLSALKYQTKELVVCKHPPARTPVNIQGTDTEMVGYKH